MKLISNPKPLSSEDLYQKQKLYIEDLLIKEDLKDFENQLKRFLSKYGNLIDFKVLKNCTLIRPR